MTQRRSRRPSPQVNTDAGSPKTGHARSKTLRDNLKREFTEVRGSTQQRSSYPSLTTLIERDAPLQAHSVLVLMYGPFQAEMVPQEGQGVASWLKECVRKHGIPSLLRFDYRHRAQIFRRDQFQPWLEPLMTQVPG
jgi:hypothetical protein